MFGITKMKLFLDEVTFLSSINEGGARMDFSQLLEDLKKAQANLETFQKKEEQICKKEAEVLHKLAKRIFPFGSKKIVNEEEALLIFVYGEQREWISAEVYLTKDGKYVTYQVYDEKKYRGFVRNADIKNGFVYVPVEKYLAHKGLKEILQWFVERPDMLTEAAQELLDKNKTRELFLMKVNDLL